MCWNNFRLAKAGLAPYHCEAIHHFTLQPPMQTPTATDFAAVDFNNPAITFGNYLAPLPESIHDVLPLTAEEKGCKILALSADYRLDEDEATGGRFAVARPVARKDWARIKHGAPVIYTELHRWNEREQQEEYHGEVGRYTSHVGTFVLCDDMRNAFYAAPWALGSDDDPLDYVAADIFEVYTIERFIEVA